MKIRSMTGFGKGIVSKDSYDITIELKTVNHRYRDIRFKMPSFFSPIEIQMRKVVKDKIRRGSVDVVVNYKKTDDSAWDYLDKEKIKSFIKEIKSFVDTDGFRFNATDFLKTNFIKDRVLDKKLEKCILEAFCQALENLLSYREVEGEKLALAINLHKKKYEKQFLKLKPLTQTYKKNLEDKLRKQFSRLKEDLNLDTPRFLQEMVYYLEKMDIAEELDRIAGHLQRIDSALEKKEVGRELDFILQELNRETNTIGAKSSNQNISNIIIDMKIELEKIREQSLNLE